MEYKMIIMDLQYYLSISPTDSTMTTIRVIRASRNIYIYKITLLTCDSPGWWGTEVHTRNSN